ncbi:MAG TPA: hypothetical protein VFB85_07460 [Vicinamibacterales bacterium]|nr:hypothetical protein [Vicinamibacterales bacterium]
MTRAAAAALAAALTIGCGKKGPPLAPIVHIPTSVDQVSARRVGNDVLVTLTVPAENVDKTKPADVGRIEVYGYTGTAAPPRGRFLDVAVLVATIPVRPVETEATKQKASEPASSPETKTEPPAGDSASEIPPAVQGASVTVRDHLTGEALVARPIPPAPVTGRPRNTPAVPPTPAATVEGPLRRFYLAFAFSPRGRVGPPGTVAELPLFTLPDRPLGVVATYAADAITLSWEPAGGVVGALLDNALPIEPSPLEEAADAPPRQAAPATPEGPTRYNVYREIEVAADDIREPAAQTPEVPPPVNGAPLVALTYTEGSLLDGRRRCYTVRAVRGDGPTAVEGEPSEPACVTPVDDVAPAPPTGLSAASAPGEITLTWEPNVEDDLAGYVVLRGEAGDATLTPVTGSVTTEVRFVDGTVRPGVRYVYAVTAIDTRLPTPNVSMESARVEETAR